jgi:hypothetical protein
MHAVKTLVEDDKGELVPGQVAAGRKSGEGREGGVMNHQCALNCMLLDI